MNDFKKRLMKARQKTKGKKNSGGWTDGIGRALAKRPKKGGKFFDIDSEDRYDR